MQQHQSEVLRRLQLTEQEILDEIVRICDSNHLHYYLIGGTLLGAVRHKGFIPWDDDLDIVMPRKDYDQFCNLCESGALKSDYYLHSINTDDKYWLIFAKVRKKNTLFDEKNIAHIDAPKGIYVDIFPLDDAKCVSSFEKRIRTKIIKAFSSVIYHKRGLNSSHTWRGKVLLALMSGFSIKTLAKMQSSLMQKDNGKGYTYYVNYGSNYNTEKQTMPKNVFDPPTLLEFEGKQYKSPKDYDYFLKRLYGDYMKLPPENKRITHQPERISFDLEKDKQQERLVSQ